MYKAPQRTTSTPQPQPTFDSFPYTSQNPPNQPSFANQGNSVVAGATHDVDDEEFTIDTSDSIKDARKDRNKARRKYMRAKKSDSFWGRCYIIRGVVRWRREDKDHCFKCNLAEKKDEPLKSGLCWECSAKIKKAEEHKEHTERLYEDAKLRKVGIYKILWQVTDLLKRVRLSQMYDSAEAHRAREDLNQANAFQMQVFQQEMNK